MKSIMQKKDGCCYLCQAIRGDYSRKHVEEHHAIMGTANRCLSEQYGLKVYLCIEHHTSGNDAVHKNKSMRRLLERDAQMAFERNYPDLSFREIFGKNFL